MEVSRRLRHREAHAAPGESEKALGGKRPFKHAFRAAVTAMATASALASSMVFAPPTSSARYASPQQPPKVHHKATAAAYSTSFKAADSQVLSSLQSRYSAQTLLWQGAQWWQSANIMYTTISGMQSLHTQHYKSDISNTFERYKHTDFVNGKYIDLHNDDAGWWASTWIKAFDFTGSRQYLGMAETIFGHMTGSWDTACGGGIWWNKGRSYKNAISNELFMMVAFQLYDRTGNRYYLNWGNVAYNWFVHSGLMDGGTHLVEDRLTKSCQGTGGFWTYNQGEFIGVLTVRAKIKPRGPYLGIAQAIANANDKYNVTGNGILYEKDCEPYNSCSTDGGMFKGIYMENLGYLYYADRNTAYRSFILNNAWAIVAYDKQNATVGIHWAGPVASPSISTESSGASELNTAVAVMSSSDYKGLKRR
ncbi:MAG: hypothetical protein KGH72_02280 [Candidatus Micrarchaeota archaeon]|nr:hypothetical protein [Candidatus Micrarchaeota archaeon]